MFEKSPKSNSIRQMAGSVFAHVKDWSRGSLLLHEQTEQITGLSRQENKEDWGRLIVILRELMYGIGVELTCEHGVGYRLTTLQDQIVATPNRRRRRARKQLSLGAKAVKVIDDEILPPELRQRKLEQEHELKRTIGILRLAEASNE